jgi:WD40 repeat protein
MRIAPRRLVSRHVQPPEDWTASWLAVWLILAAAAIGQDIPRIDDEPNNDQPILALDTGGHTNAVYKLMVSDYTRQLISVSLDKTIRLWDLESGEPARVLRPPIAGGAHGYLFSAALSPDGKLLAVGMYRALTPLYDHRIHLIEISTGQMIRSLKGHVYTIYDLAFSRNGERLASASHDGTVRIWEVATGAALQELKGHEAAVHGVAWSPDGKQVVSGSIDKTARIWSVESGAPTAVMREAQDQIMTVGWRPDGKVIAVGSNDKAIRLYDTTGKLIYQWPRLGNEITSLKFSPDSKRLLYTYGSNRLPPLGTAILDMTSGKQLAHFDGHDNSPICCTFTPDGKQAITGDSVSRVRVWDAATGAGLRRLDGRGQSLMAAGWSPDGQAIAWGTHAGDATIDVGNRLERTFCFRNLAFGPPPDKTFVRPKPALGDLQMGLNVSATPVDLRKIYFLRGGALVNTFTLPQPYDQVRCYTLLPDERAVIGTHDGAYLVDIKTGLVLRHMTERGEELWGLAPSPDFRYVLTAGNDQIMRVWRLDTGELLVALFIADEEWIAWTPQGYYAASFAGESLMGWHLNRGPAAMSDFYPASRFHKSLYRPDVIRRLMATGDLAKAVEQADRERNEQSQIVRVAEVLPAEVRILEPDQPMIEPAEPKLAIRATAEPVSGHPITSMRLIVNGRPYGPPRNMNAANSTASKIEQSWDVDLPPGKTTIAVKAESAKSYALSPTIEATRPMDSGAQRPRLFILSAGDLAGGASATAVARAAAAKPSKDFGEVVTSVLAGKQATPEAIAVQLEKIASQATLADTVLFYYAGQESLDAAGHYQLSPGGGAASVTGGMGLPASELKRRLAAIPGRLLFAVDASRAAEQARRESSTGFCNDSAADGASQSLDVAAGECLRELLSDDFGVVVLRSARRGPSAPPATGSISPFAQAFAEALGGRADENQDGVVHLHELAPYVNRRVRELSEGKETSVIQRPRGVLSFPLAQPVP